MLEIIKTRTLAVEGLRTVKDETLLRKVLAAVAGIMAVEWVGKGKLHIQYDLYRVNRRQIETEIRSHGFKPPDGLLARWRREFIDFTEENEYSNMTEKPRPCCSNPEGIVGKPGHGR